MAQNDKKFCLFHSVSEELYNQAFIKALLSTAVFPQRFSFFNACSAQWLWVSPMEDTEGKMFEIQVCRLLENAFSSDFSGNFRVYTYIQVSFMHVCKYLNQRIREEWKIFQGCFKNKKEEKNHYEIEFHNSIQV